MKLLVLTDIRFHLGGVAFSDGQPDSTFLKML